MRFIVIVLILIIFSGNSANATRVKQFIREVNAPIITNHKQAKELANMRAQLEDAANSQEALQNNSIDKLARKGGSKTASLEIIGTYKLTDSSLPEPYFLDIIDASIKNDTGAIEFVLSDSSGVLQEHSIGILVRNILTMQDTAINGAQYYVINLNPKKDYSGQGVSIYDFFADNCFDASGDGLIDIDEFYGCQYFGKDPQFATITLDRLN